MLYYFLRIYQNKFSGAFLMLRFTCPKCRAFFEMEDVHLGRKVFCDRCQTKFRIPANGEEAQAIGAEECASDKTISPRRTTESPVDDDPTMPPKRRAAGPSDDDATIPGRRDRKTDGLFQPGKLLIDRYRILSKLGQGGMGAVYKCFDEIAGIEVALKALPPELSYDQAEMEEIRENFQLVHKLHHPNIAGLNNLECDKTNGNYYLIMECCEGEDLRSWLRHKRKDGNLPLSAVLPIIRQAAEALDYAHKQKIIHRDIKPGNIMINSEGEIKILDFGLAAQIHSSMSRVSMAYHGTSGTGPYMSPEQWQGKVQGAPSDQYALAVMTYEMLSGHLPFDNSDLEILKKAVLDGVPDPIPGIPSHVQDAIKRAMNKDPEKRFASCLEFFLALDRKFAAISDSFQRVNDTLRRLACCLNFFRKRFNAIVKTVRINKGKTCKWIAAIVLIAGFFCCDGVRVVNEFWQEQKKEQAEKDRQRREEEERINNELTLWRERLTQKIFEISEKGYDCKPYIQDMFFRMNEIRSLALKAKQPAEACEKFQEAFEMATRILVQGANREAALKYREQADIKRTIADRSEDVRCRSELYKKAEQCYQSAEKLFWDGRFLEAKENFFSSERLFGESINKTYRELADEADWAVRKRDWHKVELLAEKIYPLNEKRAAWLRKIAQDGKRKAEINEKLAIACKAEQAKDWQQLYDISREVLHMDPENAEAEKMKKRAFAEMKLAAARDAMEKKDWQQIYDISQEILQTDPENAEAARLAQEAEKLLFTTLVITATVNGKPVEASVRALKNEPDRKYFPWRLKRGAEYEFEVTWRSGMDEYSGRIPVFACNESGVVRKEVALEKVSFNGVVTLEGGVKLYMVKINAGSFVMGSSQDKVRRDPTETRHRVTLTKGFWLGKFEVTQSQYAAVMKSNPSYFKTDDRPVERVSWYNAKEFCNKLNELYAGKLPLGYKFDLPSEAQWEYACRAGTVTSLNSGENMCILGMNNSPNLDLVGWYGGNCGKDYDLVVPYDISSWLEKQYSHTRGGSHPAGLKRPNNWGLYDMHGNVKEWCRDWSGAYGGRAADPEGPSSGADRVCRGGSWMSFAMECRSASRDAVSPGKGRNDLGFRLALVPVR